jgi:hypothetical protein
MKRKPMGNERIRLRTEQRVTLEPNLTERTDSIGNHTHIYIHQHTHTHTHTHIDTTTTHPHSTHSLTYIDANAVGIVGEPFAEKVADANDHNFAPNLRAFAVSQ